MDTSNTAPREESEWAALDMTDLFGIYSDASTRLSRGLPPSPLLLPPPQATKFSLPEPAVGCDIDTYFTPDMAQLEAKLESLSADATKQCRNIHSPFQNLFDKRCAVLQRVYSAVANAFTECDGRSSLRTKPQRDVFIAQADLHPRVLCAAVNVQRRTKTLPLPTQMSMCMLVTMVTVMAEQSTKVALDIVERIEKSIKSLPPFCLHETQSSIGRSGIGDAAKTLSAMFKKLLLKGMSTGQDTTFLRKVLELWVHLEYALGSLEGLLDVVHFFEEHEGSETRIFDTFSVEALLKTVLSARPAPFLGWPVSSADAPNVGQIHANLLKKQGHFSVLRIPYPLEANALCIVSLSVDSQNNSVFALIPRHSLLKLSTGKRAKILKSRSFAGKYFAHKLTALPSSASLYSLYDGSFAGSTVHNTVLQSRRRSSRRQSEDGNTPPSESGMSRERDRDAPSSSSSAPRRRGSGDDDDTHVPGRSAGTSGGPNPEDSTPNIDGDPVPQSKVAALPRDPVHHGCVISSAMLESRNLLLYVSSAEACEGVGVVYHQQKGGDYVECPSYQEVYVEFECTVLCGSTMEDVAHNKVMVKVCADSTPVAPLHFGSSSVDKVATAVRVVSAGEDETALFLATSKVSVSLQAAFLMNRVFSLPIEPLLTQHDTPLCVSTEGVLLKHGCAPSYQQGLPTEVGSLSLPLYIRFGAAPVRCQNFPFVSPSWPPLLPGTTPPHRPTSMTIEAWVKIESLEEPATVFRQGNLAKGSEVFIEISPAENGVIWRAGVRGRNVSCRSMLCAQESCFDSWNHVAAVIDERAKSCLIILNGEVLGSRGSTTAEMPQVWAPCDTGPAIGNAFTGHIAHVRVWNVARQPQQIHVEMAHCLAGDEANLVAYWTMTEGCGSVVYDRGPFHLHGQQIPDQLLPDGSAQINWAQCELRCPVELFAADITPVVDTYKNFDESEEKNHVLAWTNHVFIAVTGLPQAKGNWLIRFYSVTTGKVEYERLIHCAPLPVAPHCVTYDATEHRIWVAGYVHREVLLCSFPAPYFPARNAEATSSGCREAKTNTTSLSPSTRVVDFLHSADASSAVVSHTPVARLSQPFCVQATEATLLSLLNLIDRYSLSDAVGAAYVVNVCLRLLRYNCESVLASGVDPSVFGFSGVSGKSNNFNDTLGSGASDGKSSGFGSPAIELSGEIEMRIWRLLTVLIEREAVAVEAKALLPSVVLLTLPTPALRVATATSWAHITASSDSTTVLTELERMAFGVLLRYVTRLSNLITAVRARPCELGFDKSGAEVFLSLISVKLRKSSNLSLFKKSGNSTVPSANNTPLLGPLNTTKTSYAALSGTFTSGISRQMKGDGLSASCDGLLGDRGSNFTHFVIMLLKCVRMQLSSSLAAVENSDPVQTAFIEPEIGIGVLTSFQKCLMALSIREASGENVAKDKEDRDDECYPPVTGQLVAYATELFSAASSAFKQGAAVLERCAAAEQSQQSTMWSVVEKELRGSFVGSTLPVFVTSLALLIGGADNALLDVLDCLEGCYKSLQAFLQHVPPNHCSRPSTTVSQSSAKGLNLGSEALLPPFLLRGARKPSRRGPVDFWHDVAHSMLYVTARICGHVGSAVGQPAPREGPYEKLFSSSLMKSGLSNATAHQETSRKARFIEGLLEKSAPEMQVWANLKKNHLSNRMLAMVLQRAEDVDEVLRVVYAVVLHHAAPVADFTTLRSSSSQLPVGVLYGFSKVEGIVTKLMELKQIHGKDALRQVQERATLLLRFEPGACKSATRDFDVRMMFAPEGKLERGGISYANLRSAANSGDSETTPTTDEPERSVLSKKSKSKKRKSEAAEDDLSSTSKETKASGRHQKRNHWKRLFLSWKALRRLHQLLKLNQLHLGKKMNTSDPDSDVASHIVEVVRDPLFDPSEVDSLLKKRRARGRLRAKGLARLRSLLTMCPDRPSLLDCLIVTVKSITNCHYSEGLSASGSSVQENVQSAVYSLVNEVTNALSALTAPEVKREETPAALGAFQLEKEDLCDTFKSALPTLDFASFVLQMLGVPWQPADMAFLLNAQIPQLLSSLSSVLPPAVAAAGVAYPQNNYLPPGLDLSSLPLPVHIDSASIIPAYAAEAVIDTGVPECIVFLSGARLSVRCDPSCTSLRGTIAGSVLWDVNVRSASQRPAFYFEVTIQELAEMGAVAVGLGPANFDSSRHPGWCPNSCAYHGDDGLLFQSSGKGKQLGPTFGVGRTVGCGLLSATKEVFWTLDGQLLPTRVSGFSSVKPLVGIDAKGLLSINFGASPFRFDMSRLLSFTERDKKNEVKHLSFQLLQTLTLRASLILLKYSDLHNNNDDDEDEEKEKEPAPTQEDLVMFDQVCSPVNAASMLKSPRMRFHDTTSPLPEKDSSLLLAATNPCEASLQLMISVMSYSLIEVARVVALWTHTAHKEVFVLQLAKCCAMVSSTLHGAKLDSNPTTGDQILSCLVKNSAPYYLLQAASLQGIPKQTSHMLLQTLSVALPGIHPADASCALVPQQGIWTNYDELKKEKPKQFSLKENDPVNDTLWRLMQSAARCLPSWGAKETGQRDAGHVTASAWGAMRLLATLARSPTWHRPVVEFIESCLLGKHGQQFLITSLAVVGGLREQLGTGTLVEYCSEAKAAKERVHIVSLNFKEGTVRLVHRPMCNVGTVPLSAVSLPDPFDWQRKLDGPGVDTDASYEKDGKDLWPILRSLLKEVLNEDAATLSSTTSGLAMMVLRAVWVNVKSSPAALKWLAESGLLPQVLRRAITKPPRELPLEAAEEKALMLHSLLAEVSSTAKQSDGSNTEGPHPAMSPLPLRYALPPPPPPPPPHSLPTDTSLPPMPPAPLFSLRWCTTVLRLMQKNRIYDVMNYQLWITLHHLKRVTGKGKGMVIKRSMRNRKSRMSCLRMTPQRMTNAMLRTKTTPPATHTTHPPPSPSPSITATSPTPMPSATTTPKTTQKNPPSATSPTPTEPAPPLAASPEAPAPPPTPPPQGNNTDSNSVAASFLSAATNVSLSPPL